MAFLKTLFGKKKDKDSDGQEEFFREDFAPVVKVPSKKVAEPKNVDTAEKVSQPKKVAAKSNSSVKKDEQKKETKAPAKKVEKAPVKSSTAKKNTPAKPVAKAAAKPTSKSTAKPVAKATAKPATKSKSASRDFGDDSDLVKGAVSIKEGKDTANGKWDIRRAKDGRYFFSLYASNHSVIAYSQVYSSTTAVSTGINSVIANAPKCEIEDTTLKKPVSIPCPKWEIYLDKAGEYRFRLYAPNGLIVCHSSHGYASKGGCKGGIESIKRFSADAKIDKSYLK